jgi:hypothetical protein
MRLNQWRLQDLSSSGQASSDRREANGPCAAGSRGRMGGVGGEGGQAAGGAAAAGGGSRVVLVAWLLLDQLPGCCWVWVEAAVCQCCWAAGVGQGTAGVLGLVPSVWGGCGCGCWGDPPGRRRARLRFPGTQLETPLAPRPSPASDHPAREPVIALPADRASAGRIAENSTGARGHLPPDSRDPPLRALGRSASSIHTAALRRSPPCAAPALQRTPGLPNTPSPAAGGAPVDVGD